MKRFKKFGFTLTEIVIVMLIIAVVVGVTIRITKSKLDQITTYLYYGAFGTTKAVVQEMFNNYKFSDEDYIIACVQEDSDKNLCEEFGGVSAHPNKYCLFKKEDGVPCTQDQPPEYCGAHPSGLEHDYWAYANKTCQDIGMTLPWYAHDLTYILNNYETDCNILDNHTTHYFLAQEADESFNIHDGEMARDYLEEDQHYTNSDSPHLAVKTIGLGCANNGFNWKNEYTLFKNLNATYFSAATDFFCITNIEDDENTDIQTIPRSGAKFCEKFGSLANTNSESCNGTAISNPATTNFADTTNIIPDIILRNGMRMYNVSQCPIKIPELNNNIDVGSFGTDSEGNEKKINEWGYVIYIDIDGKDGNGKLWEDVYPFYITLSGMVIPAYDTAHPGESGGDSKFHLQASVLDDYQDATGHHKAWYTKSSSFKESACTAGYIGQDTPYCVGGENSTTKNDNCKDSIHDCRIKYVKPMKIFGANTLD